MEGQESKTQGLHCKQEERVNVRHTFFYPLVQAWS